MIIKCSDCGVEKDSSFYEARKISKTGFRGNCNQCRKNVSKERYARVIKINQTSPTILSCKTCSTCKKSKLIEGFVKNKYQNDGYSNICRECKSLQTDRYRLGNSINGILKTEKICFRCKENKNTIEFIKDYTKLDGLSHLCRICSASNQKIQHRKHPVNRLFGSAKRRSKKSGHEFSLLKSDIEIPAFCPVLGIPLNIPDDGRGDSSPTVDRIDNNKGYTPENIIVVSWRANNIKSNATVEELGKIYNFYKNFNPKKYKIKPEFPASHKEVAKRYSSSKHGAKDRGLEFNISKTDILIPKKCPVLGFVLNFHNNKFDRNSSPSIDRVNNDKGYTKDNIVVVSFRVNHIKKDATVEELGKIYNFYKNLQPI